MYPRALKAVTLAALVCCGGSLGCSGGEDSGADASDAAAPGQGASLEFKASGTSLLPNKETDLVACYRDASGNALKGELVDFALVGVAPGASLNPSRALTGEDGCATTLLRAGSTAVDLDVRARAGEQGYDLITVSVRPALGTRVLVGVRYAGQRDIATYTVTSLPNMGCTQALASGLAGDSAYNFRAVDQQATFDLGYGLKAAIVGWGRDDAGAKLVRGCQEVTAPTTAIEAEAQKLVTLDLQDIALSLADALALELEINVSTPARQFEAACERGVASVVSPNAAYSMFADADFLLDAVQSSLTAQGKSAAAAELASRRQSASLSASLQPALVAAKEGPTAYGSATGAQLAQRGASITLRWSLSSALDSTLSAFTALSADGSEALRFTSLPSVEIAARFVGELAQVAFSQLQIELGLGSYGRALLAGIDASGRAALTDKAGCAGAFASWWTKSALLDISSASDAQAACVNAVAQLDAAMQQQLSALDTSSPALALGGNAQAHPRSDDGKVDDLGPSALTGSWGADTVEAELRVPVRTAFE
jgi:hypothetical protein